MQKSPEKAKIMKLAKTTIATTLLLLSPSTSYSLRRHEKISLLQSSSLLSLVEEPTSASGPADASSSVQNTTNATKPILPPVDPDLVVIKAHQSTLDLLLTSCESSKEGLENATQAWDESKTIVVEKLNLASTSIADAHEDETDQDGTSVLQHLDKALNHTQAGLLMRPKVKGLRLIKDAVNKTSIKACGKYDTSEADFQLYLNELATRLLKNRDAMKLRITQAESEVNKALAVSNHMVKLAEHAHSKGEEVLPTDTETDTETNEETLTKTVQAVSLNANAGIKAKGYVDALKERRHALLEKLNMVLELSGQPKIEEKKAEEEVTLPPASWDTPTLSAMKSDMEKAVSHADEAKLAAEEMIGVDSASGPAEEPAEEPTQEETGDTSEPEPAPIVVVEEPTVPLTPMELLKERLDNVTRIASEHLNRTFDNATEEGEGTTMEDPNGKKAVTRTFVSKGATTTVSTMFHPKVEEDSLWKQVKKVEVGGDVESESESGDVASDVGGAAGASGSASGPSEEDELHNRITALEEKLSDTASGGADAGASGASGASGEEEEGSASGAAGTEGTENDSSSELLRTIAQALTSGSGPAEGASGASGASSAAATPSGDPTDAAALRAVADKLENKQNPDPTPFKDSKILDDVANRISAVDLKDGDQLRDIGQRLSTADATSGLEEGGKDESDDVGSLRSIANSLMTLIGDVAPKEEEEEEGDNSASGAGSESGDESASGASEEASEDAPGASGASGASDASGAEDPNGKAALNSRVEASENAASGPEADSSGPAEDASGAEEDASGIEAADPSILDLKTRIDQLESAGKSGPADDASGGANEEEEKKEDDKDEEKKEDEKKEDEKNEDDKKEDDKKEDEKEEEAGAESASDAPGASGASGASGSAGEEKAEEKEEEKEEEEKENTGSESGSESHTPMMGSLTGYKEVEESHFFKPKTVKQAEPMVKGKPTNVATTTVGADAIGEGTKPATMVGSVSESNSVVTENTE